MVSVLLSPSSGRSEQLRGEGKLLHFIVLKRGEKNPTRAPNPNNSAASCILDSQEGSLETVCSL